MGVIGFLGGVAGGAEKYGSFDCVAGMTLLFSFVEWVMVLAQEMRLWWKT
jgi:hypothetical protein